MLQREDFHPALVTQQAHETRNAVVQELLRAVIMGMRGVEHWIEQRPLVSAHNADPEGRFIRRINALLLEELREALQELEVVPDRSELSPRETAHRSTQLTKTVMELFDLLVYVHGSLYGAGQAAFMLRPDSLLPSSKVIDEIARRPEYLYGQLVSIAEGLRGWVESEVRFFLQHWVAFVAALDEDVVVLTTGIAQVITKVQHNIPQWATVFHPDLDPTDQDAVEAAYQHMVWCLKTIRAALKLSGQSRPLGMHPADNIPYRAFLLAAPDSYAQTQLALAQQLAQAHGLEIQLLLHATAAALDPNVTNGGEHLPDAAGSD